MTSTTVNTDSSVKSDDNESTKTTTTTTTTIQGKNLVSNRNRSQSPSTSASSSSNRGGFSFFENLSRLLVKYLLITFFQFQKTLTSFLPLGNFLSFISLCFLNAMFTIFYLKEGKMSWEKFISYLEKRWVYILGFGFPMTVITYFCSFWYAFAIDSFVYPIFIMVGMCADPDRSAEGVAGRLPIFALPFKLVEGVKFLWEMRRSYASSS